VYDRFTRDEISSWVWWPATMVLVVLLVLTFPGENRAIDGRRDDAAARAWSLATDTIAPALADVAAAPIQGEAAADLSGLVRDRALGDPWADVVRIWADDSTLLWSSDPADPIGTAGGLNDDDIIRANADVTRALQVVSERDLDGGPTDPTFSAYAPFSLGGEIATVQVEVADATLLGDVRGDWLGYRIVLGLAAAFTLAFGIGSMREPVARIGAGVPFYRASVPRDMDVIEVDRKVELERAGAHARERVAHMDARLRESEELRLKAEGDLQRALSQLATKPRPARSVIPRPEPADDAVVVVPPAESPAEEQPSRPEPAVVDGPATVEPAPGDEPAREAPATERAKGPVGEPSRDGLTLVPPLEERSRTERPRRDRSARTDRPLRPDRPAASAPAAAEPPDEAAQGAAPGKAAGEAPVKAAEEAPVKAAEETTVEAVEEAPVAPNAPGSKPQRDHDARHRTERSHPSRRRPAAATTWEPTTRRSVPEDTSFAPIPRSEPDPVVVIPEAPASPAATRRDVAVVPSETREREAPEEREVLPTDPDAREVLERLVEPVAVSVAPADDPSELRAALARTAARKKPGSRREERLRDDGTPA
jgi:hypothetical protein